MVLLLMIQGLPWGAGAGGLSQGAQAATWHLALLWSDRPSLLRGREGRGVHSASLSSLDVVAVIEPCVADILVHPCQMATVLSIRRVRSARAALARVLRAAPWADPHPSMPAAARGSVRLSALRPSPPMPESALATVTPRQG